MPVVDDNELPRYTLEEYIAYLRAPQWVLDGETNQSAYEANLCAKVSDWYAESENAFKTEKEIWQACYERLEATQKRAVMSASILEEAVAGAMVPIMRNTMLDEISSLYSGQYAPILKALSEQAQPMISLANRYLNIELKMNRWDTLKFDLGIDGFVADIWIVKLYTDKEEPGPFGEKERIVVDRVDPLNCFPDPKAVRWKWSLMDYFIVKEDLDIGVARARFPDKAAEIDESLAEPPEKASEKWSSSQMLVLPGQKKQWQSGVERQRIQLKECWLHDSRMKFVGHEITDPLTGESEVELDDEGYVVGQWERAYPNGRMIVTAADRKVLEDIANPYWHNGLPFEFCPMAPHAGKLFTVGKAAPVLAIERKVNDIESRVHSYAQSEIERPMVAHYGALPTNAAWFALKGQSRNMVIIQRGYEIFRPLPVEIPAFVGPYLMRLYAYKDQIVGQGGILRGDVAEGAQLSATSVAMMQGAAQGRLNMQSVYIADAMRRIGEKMLSLMRETYRKGLKAKVFTPEGKQIDVEWNEKDISNEFFVEVDIAANQPGGQQQIMNQAIQLKREELVDRAYVLAVTGIEGWEAIDARMKEHKKEEIFTQAAGKQLGVNIKKIEKADDGPTEKVK